MTMSESFEKQSFEKKVKKQKTDAYKNVLLEMCTNDDILNFSTQIHSDFQKHYSEKS